MCLVSAFLLAACNGGRQSASPTAEPTVTASVPTPTPQPQPTPSPVASASIAIINGTLIDGTGAQPLPDAIVLVQDDRIVAVGRAGQVKIPPDARVIDAGGGSILPGIIDSHVHLTASVIDEREDVLTGWLRSGVTTLRDVGTVRDGVQALREAIAGTSEAPPRVLIAGPMLTAVGGYPLTRGNAQDMALEVEGPEDAAAKAAAVLDQGADLLKVAVESGSPRGNLHLDAGFPIPSLEEVRAITEVAHRRSTVVTAHVTNADEARLAVEGNVDSLAHTPIEPLPDALLQEMVEQGVVIVSTLGIWSPDRIAIAQENLRRYVALGGRVALGTDYPFQPGPEMPLRELRLMVDGGLTPMQVLVAATKHSAEVANLEDALGTLEPGKLADIIVVAGDPLVDIQDLAKVLVVIRGGEVIVARVSSS